MKLNERTDNRGMRLKGQEEITPSVLIIDDDEACLNEYCEIIDSLGYVYRMANGGREALSILASDKSISIIITDFQMPEIDGMTVLAEIEARYRTARPIVTLMITGFGSLETAVDAMRHNAVDFLTKPISRDQLALALRRASIRRMEQIGHWQISTLKEVSEKGNKSKVPGGENQGESQIDFVRNIIKARRKRMDFLDPELFSDPAWDILLELTLAKLEGTRIPASSACASTQVPFSTAFRHLGNLVSSGLVLRWKDQEDSRRVMVELEDDTYAAILEYLKAIAG